MRLRLKIDSLIRRCRTEPPRSALGATSILQELLETVMEGCEAPMGNIQVFDSRDAVLRIRVQRGFKKEFLMFFAEVTGDTACHEAFAKRAPVVIENVATSRVYTTAARKGMLEAGALSVQSLGLGISEVRLGVISVHYQEARIPNARRDAFSGLSREVTEVLAACGMSVKSEDAGAVMPSNPQPISEIITERNRRGINIIVIGASAGGVAALQQLVAALPADLPAAVFVVLHVGTEAKSFLPDILGRSGAWPATHGVDGAQIEAGKIYVAPPDYHMVIDAGKICLSHGPEENWARPAIDPLFRSAALYYRNRVTGVILTGLLGDGAAGLRAIKESGGVAVVQSDAQFDSMPKNARENVEVDHYVPLSEIPTLLGRLVLSFAASASAKPITTVRAQRA